MDQQFPEIHNKRQTSPSNIEVEKEKIVENSHVQEPILQKNPQGKLTD
jgi:hypothetical protein